MRKTSAEHERFGELSALAVVGRASPAEYQELRRHLDSCADCREEYADFAAIIETQLPLLHEHPVLESPVGKFQDVADESSEIFTSPHEEIVHAAGSWHNRASNNFSGKYWPLNRHVPRFTVAAGLVLVILLIFLGEGLRRQTIQRHALTTALQASNAQNDILRGRLQSNSVLPARSHEKSVDVNEGRQERALALRALEVELSASRAEVQRLKDELDRIRVQEAEISARTQASEESLEKRAHELDAIVLERDQALASLRLKEQELEALSVEVSEAQQSIARDRELLAHDRDIRDLMGARNLRMIDIADVDSSGRTRKPVGRVFFTEGKSLVFYAFDLDRGVPSKKNAAFQVWGSKTPDQSSVRSLGIFYRDDQNASSWVLRCDNPHVLAEIDSVFVTIEPPGGSRKPTGARLLETTLKTEMNHP